ncbi:major facilitator superfamily domain-containing protein 8-like isoform X2 [Scylla paramamosain]|uniref:major facilitator superfamily domain-containing protein 8-like isoform X2 n=1 Tax=Scylla paramamosain TaxID=85552 RepID=UPI0030832C7F
MCRTSGSKNRAAHPLGQLKLAGHYNPLQGSAFIITMALFSLGNLLYAILNVFGSAALAVMITSRLIVGFSSGNIVIIRSYISASTTLKERTTAVSLTSAAQAVGFIVGPAIQTALAVAMSEDTSEATNSTTVIVTEEMEEAVVDSTSIQWNMYTATGWISCVLGLLNLLLFLPCIYKEYNIAAKEAQYQKRAANIEASKLPKPDYVSLFVILVTFSFTVMIYVLLETLMVPMCMDLYAWNDERAVMLVGSGLSIAAVMCVLTFVLLSFTSKVIDERIILLVGVAAQMLAMIILIPMGSTYPKIKNCTSIDPIRNHFNESLRNSDPFHFMSSSDITIGNVSEMLNLPGTNEDGVMLPETLANKSLGLLDLPLLRNTTRKAVVPTTSESGVPLPMPSESSKALRRQKRHVIHDGDCEDTGCPPEQEWCFYTPIIELPQLIVGSVCAVIGYPVVFTLASTLYSKILGPKPQGLWMGLLISIGSLSRATGPIVVSYFYTELGTRWTFTILSCALFPILVIDAIMYKKLVPMDVLKRR